MSNLPLNINPAEVLMHLLNFLILFAIMYFLLYKPVKSFMAKREREYAEMEQRTGANLSESEELKAKYEKKLGELDGELSDIREKAKKETERLNSLRISEANEEAARIVETAKEEAKLERERIIREAQQDISEMVADAIEKLALESTASEAYDQFLDAVEIPSERGNRHDHEQ